MCYEPVREFAARAPLHEAAAPPAATRRVRLVEAGATRNGAHYSRWERTPTTFGPAGRVAITAVLGAWLVSAFFTMFVVLWIVLAFVVGKILRDVWKPGWVPEERVVSRSTSVPSVRAAPLHPEPATRAAEGLIPLRTKVAWGGLSVLVLAGGLAFAYGSEEVRATVMMGGSLTLLVAWFGSVMRG